MFNFKLFNRKKNNDISDYENLKSVCTNMITVLTDDATSDISEIVQDVDYSVAKLEQLNALVHTI